MSRLLSLALTATCVAAAAVASSAEEAPKKLLSLPIVERRELAPGLHRRDDTAKLYNVSNVAYMIELTIGTPGQKVRVQVDTGSQELWLDPDCSAVQDPANAQLCESVGNYDPSQSSTAYDLGEGRRLAYGLGQVKIEYVLDTIEVPGSNTSALTDVQFGVAIASADAAVPIMGVSFGKGKNLKYNNIIDELALQGVTNSRTFSLVLGTDSDDSNDNSGPVGANIENGAILFGGVDTKKFSGPLYQYENLPPQESDPGMPWRYWLNIDGVGFTSSDGKKKTTFSNSSGPVILDSGSSLSFFPQATIDGLQKQFGIGSANQDGSLSIACDYGKTHGGAITFTFGSLTIDVPMTDFIWQNGVGSSGCVLGAMPGGDVAAFLLGDTFLRSVYALFDQDHEHIYLAKAANCGTNEQVLSAKGNYNLTGECTEAKRESAATSGAVPMSLMALFAIVSIQALLTL